MHIAAPDRGQSGALRRALRRVGNALARITLAGAWIALPLLPITALVLSHWLGVDGF